MKKYLLILFWIFILWYGQLVFAQDCEVIEDEFEKYICRSELVCSEYKENKKVFNPELFKRVESYEDFDLGDLILSSNTTQKGIQSAVKVYKENMNSIYKCAIIWAQKNSLNRILSLPTESNVKATLEPKIKSIIQKLDVASKNSKCLNIDQSTVYNKLSILTQATHLTCDYSFYMEYLKKYYDNPQNALWIDPATIDNSNERAKAYSIQQATTMIQQAQNDIQKELNQAYKIFPVVFHAYGEYENNFPLHFLLWLIREDYYTFRIKLHQTLNPINQVVYKIANAMKK